MMKWILTLVFAATTIFAQENKIVYMISGPRACSTVFMRMIEARGDFKLFHEPTMAIFGQRSVPELAGQWYNEAAFTDYAKMKKEIYQAQSQGNVFVKDISFCSQEFIFSDPEFVSNQNVHFLFLIRNPHESMLSFYLKTGFMLPNLSELVGLKQLYAEYLQVKALNPNRTKILLVDAYFKDFYGSTKKLCEHLNLPFVEHAFAWKNHGKNYTGKEKWHEQKQVGEFQKWHGRAVQSERVEAVTKYATDEEGNPTFVEALTEEDRPVLLNIFEEQMQYYQRFLEAQDDHL
ncbi:MAG: hypothetical protein MRY21_06265 [Simkaniaceae bacterium]|nr:hypothetical protein [Simkaniaceae bacterium]